MIMKMSRHLLQGVISLVILAQLIGCSSQQKIMIKSDPSQARVFIDTVDAGVTPCVVKVKKKGPEPVVRLEKNGYSTKEVVLKKKFNVAYPVKIVLLCGGMFAANLLKVHCNMDILQKVTFLHQV